MHVTNWTCLLQIQSNTAVLHCKSIEIAMVYLTMFIPTCMGKTEKGHTTGTIIKSQPLAELPLKTMRLLLRQNGREKACC